MNTRPEPSPEQIAQARGVVKDSLTAAQADPIRAALERLVKLDDAHEGDRQWEPWLNAIAAARAVLASTPPDGPAVPEGREPAAVATQPSDKELLNLWANSAGIDEPHGGISFARAVLARWGRPVSSPAEGEVGELVAWLRHTGQLLSRRSDIQCRVDCRLFDRAAALLQRQAAPVPVAVSERWPEAEDCDAEGRCWFYDPCDHGWWWFRSALFIDDDPGPLTHWLPAHALPLPSGEAANG